LTKSRPELDDIENGFDADDEFAIAPADPWRTTPAVGSAAGVAPGPIADPFITHATEPSAFDDEPFPTGGPAPASPANPVGEMIAGVEAALGDASVPRITIHIFCERPDSCATAEEATRDRRMGRATTVVRMGGLAAAVEQYQNQPTPSLVIVESQDRGAALIDLLDRLAEVCDPGTKVVVIGSHNDIALYRELMRRGVSEYLVPPLQTLQLIRAITTLYTDPSAPFVGRQIAFCGARGGVGSSTVAHNLAYTLSERMQTNTVIVDFDLPFGTAGLDFNQDPLQGVVDALSQPDRLDQVLLDRMMVRCTDRLSLFAAPATLDDDYDISAEAFEEVASKIRTTAPYVVLDLPHLWSGWMRRVLLGADDVVITAAPDLASLRNAKNVVDLMRQARPNDAPPWLVMNQVGLPGRPEIPVKDFAEALGLETALCIPFDAKLFGQAANNGQMIEELNGRSRAAEGLQQLAQVLARREPPPVLKKSPFAGLFKRK
jgi:pilus assembly protein CpaE